MWQQSDGLKWPTSMLKKIIKIKVLNGFDSFLCYLAAKTYGYICLARIKKFVRSVIILEHDSAFVFLGLGLG
jgi:hypothetical protein